jgi:hypothetical protein
LDELVVEAEGRFLPGGEPVEGAHAGVLDVGVVGREDARGGEVLDAGPVLFGVGAGFRGRRGNDPDPVLAAVTPWMLLVSGHSVGVQVDPLMMLDPLGTMLYLKPLGAFKESAEKTSFK